MAEITFGQPPGPARNPSAPGQVRKSPQEAQRELGERLFGRFAPVATAAADFLSPATPLGTASQAMTQVDPTLALGGTALGLGLGGLGMLRGKKIPNPGRIMSSEQAVQQAMRQVASSSRVKTPSGRNVLPDVTNTAGAARVAAESMIRQGFDPTVSRIGPDQFKVQGVPAQRLDALGPGGKRRVDALDKFDYLVDIFKEFDGKGTRAVLHVETIGDKQTLDVLFGDAVDEFGHISFQRTPGTPQRGMKVMRWVTNNAIQEMELAGITRIKASSDVPRATAYGKFLERKGFDVELTPNFNVDPGDLDALEVVGTIDKSKLRQLAIEAGKDVVE